MSQYVSKPCRNERKVFIQSFSILLLGCAALDVLMATDKDNSGGDSQGSSQTFRSETDLSGTELCSSDTPSLVYNSLRLEESPAVPGCVPGNVLCAWKCTRDESCIAFNWKYDMQLCELFYFVPVSYAVVAGCAFKQVGK